MDVLLSRRKKIPNKYYPDCFIHCLWVLYREFHLLNYWDAIRKFYCTNSRIHDIGCGGSMYSIRYLFKIRLYGFQFNYSRFDSCYVMHLCNSYVHRFPIPSSVVLWTWSFTVWNLHCDWYSDDYGWEVCRIRNRWILLWSITPIHWHNKHFLIYTTTLGYGQFIKF